MRTWTLFILAILIFTSCTTWRMEKRHYRNGYYFRSASNVKAEKKSMDAVSDETVDTTRVDPASYAPAEEITPEVPDDADSAIHASAQHKVNDSLKNAVTLSQPQYEDQPDDRPFTTPEDVTEEVRDMHILFLLAIGLLLLGVLAAALAFLPFVSPVFGVFIGAAPLLILAALGFAIAVMISTKRRKEAGASTGLTSYYTELHRKARIVVWIAVGIIAVFLLFLAMIIYALSQFQ